MNRVAAFRKELVKIMPGYKWTVHRPLVPRHQHATGTISSGFNRLSTLSVVQKNMAGHTEYTVRSSGFGRNALWLGTYTEWW